VIKVDDDNVELLEMIPDGNGCWKERISKLEMQDVKESGSGEK
jgi:type IV pilus assembly protein PilP